MPTLETQGISQYYELYGEPSAPPVLLITGLGGTGQTTHAQDGYTTQQLADDMAAVVVHLGLGPVHVVGASTGGAIAQYLALEHAEIIRSLTISSSFARFDPFVRREFTHDHPDRVSQWIKRAAANPTSAGDREIDLKRIDMIAAHDAYDRLGEIRTPTLVTCGTHNFCTTLALSEEIAARIPGAELVIFDDAGELIEFEQPEKFFQTVSRFIDGNS
jgi:aminoacrylate hydrolase